MEEAALDCPGRAPAGMSMRRQAGTVEQLPLAIGEANFRASGSSEYADRQHGEVKEVQTSPNPSPPTLKVRIGNGGQARRARQLPEPA